MKKLVHLADLHLGAKLRDRDRIAEQEAFLRRFFEQKGLSARAYHRILKVARTIADLRGNERIATEDLAEAAGYRGPEEKFWR